MRGIGPIVVLLTALPFSAVAQPLRGTEPLTNQGDLAMQMVDGIGRHLDRATVESVSKREAEWNREFSISPNIAHQKYRELLRRILGVGKEPKKPRLDIIAATGPDRPAESAIAKGAGYRVYQVRWEAGDGLEMEGLWLRADDPVLNVVAIPDCANTPEQAVGLQPGVPPEAQFARRLAEYRCNVLVPLLLNRESRLSQIPGRPTDIPHREFVHRAAFEFGHTLTGFEVQGVLAAIRWLQSGSMANDHGLPVGLFGYGEGGRIALYAAALESPESRVSAVVSGYFGPREQLWREPIDRNLFGILNRMGDSEIASLAGGIIIEVARHPDWRMSPQAERNGGRAAPGEIITAPVEAVRAEARRAGEGRLPVTLSGGGLGPPGSPTTVKAFFSNYSLGTPRARKTAPATVLRPYTPLAMDSQFQRHVDLTQRLMRDSQTARGQFWVRAQGKSPDSWSDSARPYREHLSDEVIGRLPKSNTAPNPRSRQLLDEPKYRGYEVVLDVYPDVFAYGILLVPKDIKEGEKRPVVVCQHGLEGRPTDVADPKLDHPAYHRYACRLAERGFVVFAPQNPYIGGDRFRALQRKANPLGLSLFSFITRQHERILEWLGTLPFVDSKRIAFYGLSYGGKTAMRVPALLEGYCLSICSADYNEWIWKNASATSPFSYLFTNEYEMPEWNLGNTFNYAEMSWLITPRPFMVERGHHDGVAPDEWVAYEYARTRRKYVELGIGDRTEIEFFNGPHTINGVGTFAFLHKHLNWPEPK